MCRPVLGFLQSFLTKFKTLFLNLIFFLQVQEIKRITGRGIHELRALISGLWECFVSNSRAENSSIREKYAQTKFGKVSVTYLPSSSFNLERWFC